MTRRDIVLLLGASLLAVSMAWGEERSAVIYPRQELPLQFSHAQHLAMAEVTCERCHPAALTSRSAVDNLLPMERACRGCHAIDRSEPHRVVAGAPAAQCVACHPGFEPAVGVVARVRMPVPNLKFNHAAHRARGISCQRCHGDLLAQGVELADRAQLPTMASCLQCHDGRRASSACTVCHLAAPGGRMQTSFAAGTLAPSGSLRGDAHDLTFARDHAAAAQNSETYCSTCHRTSECLECHDGVIRPMEFHLGDYLTLHPVEARRNSPDCSSCHRLQTFCTGCHSRSGVSSDPRGGSEFDSELPERRFHPPGWASEEGRGPEHHAFAAQQNLAQCASCHREQFCVRCHSAEPGGLRVNPHPPGWAQSRRCQALQQRNGRMCLRCHIDPEEARCR